MKLQIHARSRRLINTDPLSRCYNGAHFSTELVWTPWEVLFDDVNPDKVDDVLKFWRDLNSYAVGQRGNSARREFKLVVSGSHELNCSDCAMTELMQPCEACSNSPI